MPRTNLSPQNPDVLRVLERALELLSDRKRWTKNTLAVDSEGRHTKPDSEDAVAWCAVGAIQRAAWEMNQADHTCPDWADLAEEAKRAVTPIARTVAKAHNPSRYGSHLAEITQINDHAYWGGWATITQAFAAACGKTQSLSADIMHQMQVAQRRSEAAMKGWATRHRRRHERYEALVKKIDQRNKPYPQDVTMQPMTFGGTLPPTTADAKEKISVL